MPIISCHECGSVHVMRPLTSGSRASCLGCGAPLYQERRDPLDRALALTCAALILYVVAHSLPFMTFKLEGREQVSTLLSGVWALYQGTMWPLAALVFLTATLCPAAKLLASLYVLLPLRLGWRPLALAQVFRLVELFHLWAMMEVYLLGVIVAYVKLRAFADLELGPSLYAFALLIITMIAAETVLDPRVVWEKLGAQATGGMLARFGPPAVAACHACDQLAPLDHEHDHKSVCPRCGSGLHKRKTDSLSRTWALVLTAVILYIPANLLPVMTVVSFGKGEPDTILSGVMALLGAGMWPIALLVFFASIVVPVLKLSGLVYLLLSVRHGWQRRLRDRTLMYRIIESVGRWSMVDIFMISILVALVNLGSIATIEPGPGALSFAAVVIMTMLASMSFDPRLMWDSAERSGHDVAILRV